MDSRLIPTRAAGLARLDAVVPRMGRAYAETRNTDLGPEAVATTSGLSPYLSRRLVTEREVVAAILAAHGPEGAEKFVQEVFWRSYFKGYLETRPGLWSDYRARVEQGRRRLDAEAGLRKAYEAAIAGRTGIDGFDDWARDLVGRNWLHNHARMWFASIWIFTLGLPWALGADFFLRHLLDGDAASNTLSWRWVAGLHTRGKHYLARSENIRRYTQGRYDPRGLNEEAEALDEPESMGPSPLQPGDRLPPGAVALLLHLDDLHPESLVPSGTRIVKVGGTVAHAAGASEAVMRADREAMDDALLRASAHFRCPAEPVQAGWADGLVVVAPWAPVGPSADVLPAVARLRRPWDDAVWPHATRGFFKVKTVIPRILDGMA